MSDANNNFLLMLYVYRNNGMFYGLAAINCNKSFFFFTDMKISLGQKVCFGEYWLMLYLYH